MLIVLIAFCAFLDLTQLTDWIRVTDTQGECFYHPACNNISKTLSVFWQNSMKLKQHMGITFCKLKLLHFNVVMKFLRE